jgi:hypothetical protein
LLSSRHATIVDFEPGLRMIFRKVKIFPRTLVHFLQNEISEVLSRGSSYPFDKWTKGLQFEERGGTLHMRSVYSAYPYGLIWVAAVVVGFAAGIRKGTVDPSRFPDVLYVAAFGFAGLVALTIRSIDTSFDPANGTILYRRSIFSVVWDQGCFSFAETSGVFFEPDVDFDDRGWLYLVLKDGSSRLLTHQNGLAAFERAIEAIHAATGLTKIANARVVTRF